MNLERIFLESVRSILLDHDPAAWKQVKPLDYYGQSANDYVLNCLKTNDKGLLVAKFGTVELNNLCAYVASSKPIKSIPDIWWFVRGYQQLYPNSTFLGLCNNAGFFPQNIELGYQWKNLVLEDMVKIDILGSYIRQEQRFKKQLMNAVKIQIEGYLAPFLWNNPWTSALRAKRVLVVHPFVDTIAKQYEKRSHLFDNPDVLPDFSNLQLVKAVQSIAGNGSSTGFSSWFDALSYMKSEMDKYEYDVALIGCGAYGMHLAAHAKKRGKIGIHMAGWTQMLFGIYGNRWLKDQPEYAKFINDYWVRPSDLEKPRNADSIEHGCYW